MTQQPIRVSWRFDYFADVDHLQFSLQLGPASPIMIRMDAESFLALCEAIAGTGQPFLEVIKKRRAEGIKQDMKAEITSEEFDKLIELKKKLEGDKDAEG